MRRPNGSGTIVKLAGNRRRPYAVRVSTRDSQGHIIQNTLGYYARIAEAQAALDEYNKARANGTAPAADKLKMTVGEVYAIWAKRKYAKASEALIQSYSAAWNKRISRYADRKMRDMTLDDWQAILDEGEDQGRGQSTINNDAYLIKALNACAMERDIIGKDYSSYLDIPNVDPKVHRGAFDDLALRRLEQLAAEGYPWADTVLMLCYTGFRISEFLQLTRFSYHTDPAPYLQGGLKTAAGKNRIVPIHPKIQPYVDQWIAKDGQAVICQEDGRPIPSYMYREDFFKPIAALLGYPDATPHWCRYTFATLTKSAGVDDLARKRILGHADGSITDHYTDNDIRWLIQEVKKVS